MGGAGFDRLCAGRYFQFSIPETTGNVPLKEKSTQSLAWLSQKTISEKRKGPNSLVGKELGRFSFLMKLHERRFHRTKFFFLFFFFFFLNIRLQFLRRNEPQQK